MLAISPFLHQIILDFNTSKYISGIMMILLNLGGRYLSAEISDFQEEFFESPYVRRIFIFVVCFVATHDFMVSLTLTLVFIVLVSGIFNENSQYCILPVKKRNSIITKEEYMYAQSIVNKYNQQQLKKIKNN